MADRGGKSEDWLPLADSIIREPDKCPNLMRRCIVDVIQTVKVVGGLKEKFTVAVAICGTSLRKSGRLNENAPLENTKLTPLGRKRDRDRRRERDQARKAAAFKILIGRLRRDERDATISEKAKNAPQREE